MHPKEPKVAHSPIPFETIPFREHPFETIAFPVALLFSHVMILLTL